MFNDRFAELLARKLSGEASESEIGELQSILKDDPQAHYFYEIFCDYWGMAPKADEDNIQEEIHFQQIIAIAEKEEDRKPAPVVELEAVEEHRMRPRSWLAVAVFIGMVVGTFFWLKQLVQDRETPPSINQVATRKAARTQMMLPDGTRVWLNSDSRLEYKGNFNDSLREVTLEGEAFFDVVRDKSRPFIVHTSDIDIKVLGTAFNVKSYPKESSIEATLIHGMIEVTNKKEPTAPKVILRPHEKLVFQKVGEDMPQGVESPMRKSQSKPVAVIALPKNIADSLVVETSWVYNKLVFDGETLRENAAKMERWYNKRIRFMDGKVANIPIHYKLENETVEEALKALQYIENFEYKIKGDDIEIYKK